MSEIQVGDRVSWPHKGQTRTGQTRTGTVEQWSAWSNYAYVRLDSGNRHFVSKARMMKVEPEEDMTMDEETTGRLNILTRILAAHRDDLSRSGSTTAERETSNVLDALRVAIEQGKTTGLANLTRRWLHGRLRDEVFKAGAAHEPGRRPIGISADLADALTDAEAFDRLSAIVGEMALPGDDADELADERREWERSQYGRMPSPGELEDMSHGIGADGKPIESDR